MPRTLDWLIRHADVFDGTVWLGRPSVGILGEIVVMDPPAARRGPVTRVIDATGKTLLPGLIDGHTHAFPADMGQCMAFGVTTQIDMFNDPKLVRSLKRAAERSPQVADLRSATIGVTCPGGHPTGLSGVFGSFPTLTERDDPTAFVDARIAEGADFLKVFVDSGTLVGQDLPRLEGRRLAAVVEAAHARGLAVVAHATTAGCAADAVRAGVDGLAHVFVDVPAGDGLLAELRAAGVFVTTTVAALAALAGTPVGRHLTGDERVRRHVPPGRLRRLAAARPDGDRAAVPLDRILATVRRLHQAGIRIIAGTDAPNAGTTAGAGLHLEIDLLVAAGLPVEAALAAATSVPAAAFGLRDRGRIADGARADLVLVDGSVTGSPRSTLAVDTVWRGGRRFDSEAYRGAMARLFPDGGQP
ncbi:MAG: amidohydrolase family protein [Mycobacteriales bacterium]